MSENNLNCTSQFAKAQCDILNLLKFWPTVQNPKLEPEFILNLNPLSKSSSINFLCIYSIFDWLSSNSSFENNGNDIDLQDLMMIKCCPLGVPVSILMLKALKYLNHILWILWNMDWFLWELEDQYKSYRHIPELSVALP